MNILMLRLKMKKSFRNSLSALFACLLIVLGFPRRAKRRWEAGNSILSIYFHAPSKSLFEFCIRWLVKRGFQFLSQDDLLAIYNKTKAFPKKSVIITVDDGWQTNQENVVSVATQYQIPVTIFVTTDAIETGNFWWSYIDSANTREADQYRVKYLKTIPNQEREKIIQGIREEKNLHREALTVEELQTIATSNLVTIGGHTVSHPILTRCDEKQVRHELSLSKRKLEAWLKKPVPYFAYPNGSYSGREIELLQETGYALAYTTKPACITPQTLKRIYELPRFHVFDGISKLEAICRMTGVWQQVFKG